MPRSSAAAPRSGDDHDNSRHAPSSSDRSAVISDCHLAGAEEQKKNGDGNDDDDEEEYEEIEVEVYEEIEEEIEVDDDEEEQEVEEGEEEKEEEAAEEKENEAEEEEVEEDDEEIGEEEVEEEEEGEDGEGEEEDEEEEVEIEVEVEEEVEEEVEVEVEEEVEVEVELEEDEELEEEKEEMPDTSKKANGKRDVSQVIDFEGNNSQLGSHSTPKEFELRPHSSSVVEDDIFDSKYSRPSNELLTKEDESCVHSEDSKCLKSGEHSIAAGKNGSQESIIRKDAEEIMMKDTSEERSRPHNISEAHFYDNEVVAAKTNSQLTSVVSNALAMNDCSDMKPNNTMSFQEEVKSMEKTSEDFKEKTASRFSRLITSEIRTQNLCPSAELKDQSKHPEVICDFFAKGWCIRGSSCRFLHIKNQADKTLEGDSEAAFFSKSDHFDKGLRNTMEKPKLPSNHDTEVSSIGNDAIYPCDFSLERTFQVKNQERQRLHQLDDKDKYSSLQQEGLGFSSSKDIGIQNHKQNWHSADYESYVSPVNRGSSPSLQNSLLPEHRSYLSGSAATLSNHHGLNSSSYSNSLEHQLYIRSRSLREAKFDDSLSSSHKLPSHHISAWTGSSFSFGSPLNTGPFGSQKLLGNDTDYNASRSCSLLQIASPLSISERGSLPLASNHRRNWNAADYGSYVSPNDRGSSPSLQNGLLPERRSYLSGSATTISKYHGLNSSSCSSSIDNQTYIRSQSVHGAKVDDSLSSSRALASHHISTWTGSSFSFGSYLRRSPFDSQKMLPNDRDCNASRSYSFLQSPSPLSGSDRGNLPGDLLCYAKHKEKIASDKWEQSLPFQPSSIITPTSSSDNRCDRLCDKSDLPAAGYRLPFNFPFGRRTSSIDILNQPAYRKSLESGAGGPQNDTYGTGTVTGENCVVNGETGSVPDEEIGSSNVHQKDVPNASTVNVACDSTRQDDGHRHKKVKVNRETQNREMEVDKKTDAESKATRQFHFALVDVVKELLKPTWREGHLSKDAHNTIVKKAVEKVLGSLEPHQIPSTMESIKLYLSSSQPKLAKLVEGYCAKYGKS